MRGRYGFLGGFHFIILSIFFVSIDLCSFSTLVIATVSFIFKEDSVLYSISQNDKLAALRYINLVYKKGQDRE